MQTKRHILHLVLMFLLLPFKQVNAGWKDANVHNFERFCEDILQKKL